MKKTKLKPPGAPHFGFFIIFATLITMGAFLLENALQLNFQTYWDLARFFLPFLLLLGLGIFLWEKQREINNKLFILSITDPLTGALNHIALFDRMRQLMESDEKFAIVFMDIDNFKPFNDKYGHIEGNKALIELVNITKSHLNDQDFIARFGGDEFIIVSRKKLESLEYIIRQIANHFQSKTNLSISYGIAVPDENDTESTLIHKADYEMYKQKGRKCGKNS
ncbi:hypothetical protein DRQ33_00665 [bacterium]|nr:MAG: hypothetical protein DRQ33_00665 [bacterium]